MEGTMKKSKTLIGIIFFFIILQVSLASATYDYSLYWYFNSAPVNNVSMQNYRCLDNGCYTLGTLVESSNSGASNLITTHYPIPAPTHGYATYWYSSCYQLQEMAWKPSGNGAYTSNAQFTRYNNCRANITSISAPSTAEIGTPIVISALVKSAIREGPLPPFSEPTSDPNFVRDFISSQVNVTLTIKNSTGDIIFTNIKTNEYILHDSLMNFTFASWTPATYGNYTAYIQTDVPDCKCNNSLIDVEIIKFSIPPECDDNDDCDDLNNDYCSGDDIMHDEGICVDYECDVNTTLTENCDNGLYCDGDETCSNADCVAGAPINCNDGIDCTDDSCDETNDECDNAPDDDYCDDDLYCNGIETCNVELDCQDGTSVSCTGNDISGIATCLNIPDNIDFTWDFRNLFTSVCNESADSCTAGSSTITHDCSVASCGAECDTTHSCSPTDCDNLDGCHGNDYWDYNDVSNSCLGDCTCTDNICTAPIISYNDSQCTECQDDSDCINLTDDYCSGNNVMHDEGICVNYECTANISTVEDCDVKDGIMNDCGEMDWSCIEALNTVECVLTDVIPLDYLCSDFCQGDLVIDGFCNSTTYKCNYTQDEDCNDYNYDYCDGTEIMHADHTCSNVLCVLDDLSLVQDCDDNAYCNGQESCSNASCSAGTSVNCNDGVDCTNDSCDEINDECDNAPDDDFCDDDLYCNGEEYCDIQSDCQDGTSVSCTGNDISGIATCLNIPDNIDFTWDFRNLFTSVCNESADSCTAGSSTITHDCSVDSCGAECDTTHSCSPTDCDTLDGCHGNDYWDYTNVSNSCLGDCTCTDNICTAPIISYNDSSCTQCDNNSDCNYLDDDYCSGSNIMHDEGICVNYQCTVDPIFIQNCNDAFYCNGVETCFDADCFAGTPINCNGNDITGIATCDNNPDLNTFTWDFRNLFTSVCNESADSCTAGSSTITHDCSVDSCGAECDATNDCDPTECDNLDGCHGNDYWDYTNVSNSCLGDCTCTDNICTAPIISYNDSSCTECDNNSDCNYLDDDYCSGSNIMHDEGICVNYQCTVDPIFIQNCNDAFYCNGVETCFDADCFAGTPINCNGNDITGVATCYNNPDSIDFTWDFRNLFTSVCNESADSCTTGSSTISHDCSVDLCDAECDATNDCDPTECDNLDGCHGNDYYNYTDTSNSCLGDCTCTDNSCTAPSISYYDPRCTECQDDSDCINLTDDYCSGSSIMHDEGICVNYECTVDTDFIYNCNDAFYCNGVETCFDADCFAGTPINCNGNNITGIATCDNNPDINPFTWDFRSQFTSVCNEPTDSCTTGSTTISHTCNVTQCDAECDATNDCDPTECDNLDGCHGNDYYNYTDTSNSCQGDCTCSDNSCTSPVITYNHPDCTPCDNDIDCNYLDNDYCSGSNIMHDEGICVNYQCTVDPIFIQNCNDAFYCNGVETCFDADCFAGAPINCNDGVDCTDDSCDEINDECDNTPDDDNCDDGLYCNGEEYCDAQSDCQDGTSVDCSANNLDPIGTCNNIPDDNPFTYDYFAGFTSVCNEPTELCTTGSVDLTHTCDMQNCEAECEEDSDCTEFNDGICLDDCTCQYTPIHDIEITPSSFQSINGIRVAHANFTSIFDDPAVLRKDNSYKIIFKTINDGDFDENVDFEGYLFNNMGAAVYAWFPSSGIVTIPGFQTRTLTLNTLWVAPGLYTMFVNASIVPDEVDYTDNWRTRQLLIVECYEDSECDDNVSCTDDECSDDYECINEVNHENCDDGLYCNGNETCDAEFGCMQSAPIDCSTNNITGISTCDNSPDDNIFTWDFRTAFQSLCDEVADTCTTGSSDIAHTCDTAQCGAECDAAHNCTPTECDYLDQCIGDDYYDYEDIDNECLGNCSCTENSCSSYAVIFNHPDCTECQEDSDCINLTSDYCSGDSVMHDEGICVDYNCTVETTEVQDCEDDLFCNGDETCSDAHCMPGIPLSCDDNVSCTMDQCDEDSTSCIYEPNDDLCSDNKYCNGEEICDAIDDCMLGTPVVCDDSVDCTDNICDDENDTCIYTANNSNCDDGEYCNGLEICDVNSNCLSGDEIECSANNLDPIETCNNIPDSNPFTWDYFAGFNSECNEDNNSCTVGTVDLTHLCETDCGSQSKCDGREAGVDNCTVECKWKPPYICERDGTYGLEFEDGHEYVCADDNTYFQCNHNGSAYVHVDICSYYCSADLACEGVVPGATLTSCDIYGETYLEDYCDGSCQLQDDHCESGNSGCTADPECDEIEPGTDSCTDECTFYECTTNSDCTDSDYCNGVEYCGFDSRCHSGTPINCNDGLYCNGNETCDEDLDECIDGDPIDCSSYDLDEIEACDYTPDNNPFTWDYFAGFTSVCEEADNRCSTSTTAITHDCSSSLCGAECEDDLDCELVVCDDDCLNYRYRDCEDAQASCDNCACLSETCPQLQTCPLAGTDIDSDAYDEECGDCDDSNSATHPGAPEICDEKDNDCDGKIDEGLYDEFFRISYSSLRTGDVVLINGYDNFSYERVDFFHGYILNKRGIYSGFGSMNARATTSDGLDIMINIKFDVTDLIEQTCEKIVWDNYARGTYWVDGVGVVTVYFDYMHITYYTNTGIIDAIGDGDVDFEFQDMIDTRFTG